MELQPMVGDCFARLAGTLAHAPIETWDAPSLCEGWRVREVVAHVTMPARFTDAQFADEMAAANGDFQTVSDLVATRDSDLPVAEHLANLRSRTLAEWQPPGGGSIGALNHAVVHSLDITNALHLAAPSSSDAARAILDSLTSGGVAAMFGVDLEGTRLEATDLDWTCGEGTIIRASAAELISLATHRRLPDGRTLATR